MGPQMEPQTICWNYYLNLLTSAGYYSVSYCHLSSSKATIGRYVKAGEILLDHS